METQVLIKLSAIIDKMNIDLSAINGKNNEEVGSKIINLLLKNLYKAENEIYELIALSKKITVDEAKKQDIIAFVKDLLKIEGLQDFLA